MKKIYATLLTLAAATSLTLSAQQLPNADFEGEWNDCTPFVSGTDTPPTTGKTPANWTISHVGGMKVVLFGWQGATQVGSQTTPGYNSNSAATIVNSPNSSSFASDQIVPGYITLGTTWSTAKGTSASNKDGGTFGGINFTYRPDAISFYYKRSHGTDNPNEKANIIAYLWKGTYTQQSVPANIANSPKTMTMENRDRVILGINTPEGGTKDSTNCEHIASVCYDLNGDAENWTNLIIPIDYRTSTTPEMFNIIFSAGDYFSTTPGKDNSLTIDDIKLIYYSRLKSLKINGEDINGFSSDKYSYTIDSEMPEESAFSFLTLGNSNSATAKLTLDKENAIATIAVSNSNNGGTDIDGLGNHTYSIQFNKGTETPDVPDTPITGDKYDGDLAITMFGATATQQESVYISANDNGTCNFLLPNFILKDENDPDESMHIGDIKVENITKTLDGNKITYNGTIENLSLLDGMVSAHGTITGTEENGKLYMFIHVIWEQDGSPIEITFNGTRDLSAGIGGIEADNTNAPVEYYNLKGVRIAADNLTPGIYIRRQGTEVIKILIRK